jgi:N-acetyl-alpha-D-muramate 1-phosphate uridylyltransferase
LQAVILAGGLGTRLGDLTKAVPKPMVLVEGKPFLEHEVGLLKLGGIDDFVLCVGYLGEVVEGYFGDGARWGVTMRYSYDGPRLLGPVGALKGAEPLLKEHFFVTYGDAYLRVDYARLMAALVDSRRLGVMAVYENNGRYGKSDLLVSNGFVTRYDKSAQPGEMEWVNFGVSALRKEALGLVAAERECGEEEFYGKLIERGELAAFPVDDRFYEIGTPQSLKEFERFISSGAWRQERR